LEVVAKAIYPLNFYSGSSMCPAAKWIISGLRNRRKNDTATAPELFFSWFLSLMSVALALELSFLWFPLQLRCMVVFTH